MDLLAAAKRFLTLEPMQPLHTRSFDDHPGFQAQMSAIWGSRTAPWRVAGMKEALGVPAIHRAVTLISNTGGALTLNGYRNGVRMADDERPALIKRPNPFATPRDFTRDSIYSMATRGELWWWVAMRDSDGKALSLVVVPPAQVTVEVNPRDLLRPIIKWQGVQMRNEDMVQITLMREPGELRGFGPLQVCGAAISVSVEAQEWAANFFSSGGVPSVVIKAAGMLGGDSDPDDEDALSEAARLKAAFTAGPANVPKVIDQGIESVEQFGINEAGAQMNQAREFQNGEAARMFGVPSSLLDHSTPGSNLTYQNLEQELAKFVRTCLWPNYLEPIEQQMSDLLPRSTTARFNIDALLRADIKTRYEVYKLGVSEAGILDREEARQMEGLEAGDIETAPVPFAAPAAIPTSLPIQARSAEPVRCDGMRTFRRSGVTRLGTCNALLSESGPFVGTCRKCKKRYEAA